MCYGSGKNPLDLVWIRISGQIQVYLFISLTLRDDTSTDFSENNSYDLDLHGLQLGKDPNLNRHLVNVNVVSSGDCFCLFLVVDE